MRQILHRVRAHYMPLGGRILAHVRNDRYSEYPRYAFLLGLSVALFSRLPLGSDAMLIGSASSQFAFLACVSGAVGSGLAVAMALVGGCRPGADNILLSSAAIIFCCVL
jgi:hypothetical protein